MQFLWVLFFLFLGSLLFSQDLGDFQDLDPREPARELPTLEEPIGPDIFSEISTPLPPQKSSDEASDFYSYSQALPNYRGLQVTALVGYRVPKNSPLEAGFELLLTFKSLNLESQTELEKLGDRMTIQIYAPRSGLLRYRVILNRQTNEANSSLNPEDQPSTQITYQASEKQAPFFLRLLNELEGGRTAELFLAEKDSRRRTRINFSLNLSPLQDLWEFSQKLKEEALISEEASPAPSESPHSAPIP